MVEVDRLSNPRGETRPSVISASAHIVAMAWLGTWMRRCMMPKKGRELLQPISTCSTHPHASLHMTSATLVGCSVYFASRYEFIQDTWG